jgi:hypothetical protein
MKYFYLAMCMLSLVTSIALKLDGDSVESSLTFIKALLWLNLFWLTMVWERLSSIRESKDD